MQSFGVRLVAEPDGFDDVFQGEIDEADFAVRAYSGARLSEVCQLRAEDIFQQGEFWCMKFDPKAGPGHRRRSPTSGSHRS